MPSQSPTYTVKITVETLEVMKEVLFRSCVCQNEAFDGTTKRLVGLGDGRSSHRLFVGMSIVGLLITLLLLATTRPDELVGRIFLGSLALFFGVCLVAQWWLGPDGIQTVRRSMADPLIRWTVNREMDRAIKHAPYSVVYEFLDGRYLAHSPELKYERTIGGDDVALAYKSNAVYCLFRRPTSQGCKSIILAPEPAQRQLVENFLKHHAVELRDLDLPPIMASVVDS